MKRESVSKVGMVVCGLLVACGVVAFGPRAVAEQESSSDGGGRCTARTIRGDYGFSIDGTIAAGTPGAFLLRGVAMTHFDGRGNLTQVDFATRNGAPLFADWRPGVGTYELNPDCTGTAEIIQSDGSPTLHLRLVVMDRGRQIRTIVVGSATGSAGVRVD
jgi:hypothetical protein